MVGHADFPGLNEQLGDGVFARASKQRNSAGIALAKQVQDAGAIGGIELVHGAVFDATCLVVRSSKQSL